MRIGLLTYSTRPRGGVVHTLALAEALAAAGEEVSVLTLARGGDAGFFRPVDPAVEVVVAPFDDRPGETVGERVLRSIEALRPVVAARSFDVVHAQDCISANAATGAVRTVHHLDQFETPELVRCHERALREPIAHVCVSHAVAAELAEGWGIRAEVIPNGVDAARFAAAAGDGPAACAARDAWRAQIGRPYVLAVGGIEPRKGSIELLEAWARARDRIGEPAALVVAGGETLFDYRPYRERWEQRAGALGIEPVVLGPVDHDLLPALVAAARVFAFPSTKEGFGLAALEAAAAGVPVVVSDLPVLAETLAGVAHVGRGEDGLADALVAAWHDRDPDRRAAGARRAGSFTWAAAAAAHRRLYAALLAGS